jgi:Helix-hairpin-helix motif
MMRRVIGCVLMTGVIFGCYAQEEQVHEINEESQTQRLMADRPDQSEDEDGGLYLDHLLRFRLPINTVHPERLSELPGITPIQIQHFLLYRDMLGPFIDIMELQAIPAWDPETIRRILPYVKLADRENQLNMVSERFKKGEHLFLLRAGRAFDATPASTVDTTFRGTALRTMFRYNYRFGNLMQWGVTMESDPGEKIWIMRRGGADFLSGHFAVRALGMIRSLVLGDFQVSLGQGLTHWQGMSFGMGSDAMSILRQAPVLKPYNGTDEHRFHRGGGLHIKLNRWDAFLFHASDRKDANLVVDSSGDWAVRSVLSSGLHRTESEMEDRDALKIRSTGLGIRYSREVWHIGWQAVRHQFGHSILPEDEPYRLYAIRGNHWMNQSISWGGTIRNIHAFGEAALDLRGHLAFVKGMLLTLHRDLDISLMVRQIDRGYRAWQADAHTAQGEPMNEHGVYAGGSFRPFPGVKLDGWLDISRFPFLKYRVDAPSIRNAQLLSLQWQPDKRTRLLWRWQGELTEKNQAVTSSGMRSVMEVRRRTWRWHMEHALSTDVQLRFRADASRVSEGAQVYKGGLFFIDVMYKPPMARFKCTGRLAWYEADNFAARLFAYEQDVPFQQTMSMMYGRGIRAYMVLQLRPERRWQCSLKTGANLTRDADGDKFDVRFQITYRCSRD